MRKLLIVDRSGLLAWRLKSLSEESLEVLSTPSFQKAVKILEESQPDVAIFFIRPCQPEWRELVSLCACGERPLPFLCMGDQEYFEAATCPTPCRKEDLIPPDVSSEELGRRLRGLFEQSREPGRHRNQREKWVDRATRD